MDIRLRFLNYRCQIKTCCEDAGEWSKRERGKARTERWREIRVPKLANHTDEKSHSKVVEVPVLQTDTGRRGEEPKTNERNIVKELGKLTP